MEPNRPKNDTRFKPGNRASVGKGRPKVPDELKAKIRDNPLLTRDDFRFIIDKYMKLSTSAIQQEIQNPNLPAVEIMIAKIVAEGIKSGDTSKLNFLLDRHVGKVKEVIEQDITVRSVHEQIVDEIEKLENSKQKGGQ